MESGRDEQAGDRRSVELSGQPATFEKLRELTRNGYVPDPDQEEEHGGILLRHESAPDLILRADGTIDLPPSQTPRRPPAERESGREKRIYWRRTFLVVVMTIAVWFLSLAIAATLIETIAD